MSTLLTHATEQIMIPQSGKKYTLDGTTPTGDTLGVDPTTQQQVVIPKADRAKFPTVLTPADQSNMPSSSTMPQPMQSQPFTMSSLVAQLTAEAGGMSPEEFAAHLQEDIQSEHQEIMQHHNMIEDDMREISEDEDAINAIQPNSALLQNIVGAGGRSEYNGNRQILSAQKRWGQQRKELAAARDAERAALVATSSKPVEKMNVNERIIHARNVEAAYNGSADATGHDKVTGLPMKEPGKVEVGMTEFPAGEKKGKGDGYNLPFHEMDQNQVAMREHFDNEKRLPTYNMQRRELSEYRDDPNGGKKNLGLSEQQKQSGPGEEPELNIGKEASLEEQALQSALGFSVTAADNVPAQEGPVVHKPLKTQPKIDEYQEPAMIPQAEGKAKESITKLRKVQADITALTKLIADTQKPFMDSMQTAVKPLQEQMGDQKKLLQSYLDMAYNSLNAARSTVAAYEQSIYAALERGKNVEPNVTLSQLLTRLETVEPELAAKVQKLQEEMKTELSQTVLEKFLYEYPISKSHEKRIQASSSAGVLSVLQHVITTANEIIGLIAQELDTINV